jgi:hypothetical protein
MRAENDDFFGCGEHRLTVAFKLLTRQVGQAQTRWGCDFFDELSQGSSFLATLAWWTESRWDSRQV